MISGLWVVGLFVVGVTSNPELKLGAVDAQAAVAEWTTQHVPVPTGKGAKQRLAPLPKALAGPLHFELTGLQIPNVSAFGPVLAAYLQREMARGWLVQGTFGAADKQGERTAVFTRSHPRLALDWGTPGRATPVACAAGTAAGGQCALVVPEQPDGAAFIELGGRIGKLRIFPRVLVTLTPGPVKATWVAQTHILVLLKAEDAEKLKVPPGELGDPMQATLAAILGGLRVAPTVDGNRDGVADAWRFEAGATFEVTLVSASAPPPGKPAR